jgi:hypothetical protein
MQLIVDDEYQSHMFDGKLGMLSLQWDSLTQPPA